MRNLLIAVATLAVFAIAAAGSGTPESKKSECTMQSCPQQAGCGGCNATCK